MLKFIFLTHGKFFQLHQARLYKFLMRGTQRIHQSWCSTNDHLIFCAGESEGGCSSIENLTILLYPINLFWCIFCGAVCFHLSWLSVKAFFCGPSPPFDPVHSVSVLWHFLGIGAGMRSVSLVPLTPVRRDTGAARSGRLILCPNEAAHVISCAPKRSKKMTQPVPLDTGVKRREALSMQPPRRAIVLVASGVRGRQWNRLNGSYDHKKLQPFRRRLKHEFHKWIT